MVTPEQVPEEAWRATGLSEIAGRAVVAALNAWPGMRVQEPHSIKWYPTVLILPLTETPDE